MIFNAKGIFECNFATEFNGLFIIIEAPLISLP